MNVWTAEALKFQELLVYPLESGEKFKIEIPGVFKQLYNDDTALRFMICSV
jgi:hypothetical protein